MVVRVFKDKSARELLTALFVFRLCRMKFLVRNNEKLLEFGRKTLGNVMFERFMKMTFYGHFVGGENEVSLKPLISKLEKNGIGAILDYAVEKDISRDEAVEVEMESCVAHDNPNEANFAREEDHIEVDQRFLAHREFGDRRQRVISAKTYFYEDESQCDENVSIFLRCINTAANCSKDGFAAIKLTSLGRPQFLLQLSAVLSQTRAFFDKLTGPFPGDVLRRSVSEHKFLSGLDKLGLEVDVDVANKWFTMLDTNQDGSFNLLDWNALSNRSHKFSKLFVAPDPESGELMTLMPHLTDEEENQMKNMIARLDILAKAAEKSGVKLMIDAEQTYFQPAISRLTMELMKKYNKDRPIIFNTYQCYLKEAFNNISIDMKFAEREEFHFGAKLVRGAYLEQERKRAADIGYPDPINPDYESTSRMYDRVVGDCLTEISAGKKLSIMVASHNEASVRFTRERMHHLGINPDDHKVYFGQLLGMCDRMSFELGLAGYPVYKYVPFGPVREVMPYLSRRALENSSMLAGTGKELKMITNELKLRCLPWAPTA